VTESLLTQPASAARDSPGDPGWLVPAAPSLSGSAAEPNRILSQEAPALGNIPAVPQVREPAGLVRRARPGEPGLGVRLRATAARILQAAEGKPICSGNSALLRAYPL
jgi:hypothetical protein